MKNSIKRSRYQKNRNSNKIKSIRSKRKKNILLKGSGLNMDKLLSDEFKTDYIAFTDYLDMSGDFIEDERHPTPEFRKIREKYFTRDLYKELIADREILKQYLLANGHFFKNLFNEHIDRLEDLPRSIIDHERWPYRRIVKLLANKRICSKEEFMIYNEEFDVDDCTNYSSYMGNCGYPSLYSQIKVQTKNVDKIVLLFNIIRTKLEAGKKIGIIIGSIQESEFNYEYDINLYFNMCIDSAWKTKKCDEYKDIDMILHEISTKPLKQNYLILNFFPLNTHPTNMPLLNLIVELMENYHIYLINNMCKTCFGSFYYLKREAKRLPLKRNFEYINQTPLYGSELERCDPEKLGIQNCFL